MQIMDNAGIHYDYRPGQGYLEVEGKTCWLLGCHNETAGDIIKGMTLGGADLDEADTYPKTVMDIILDRLSLDDSRAYMTMNSNSPYHYIKTDLIDNTQLLDEGKLYTSHWVLYDNPFLPHEYIETMEARYPKGTLGWKRKIMGWWVLAEGAIYDRFVEAQHTFHTPPYDPYDYYVISSDYGSGNVTVFGLFGIKQTVEGNHYHLLKEFYWDAIEHGQLTDSELIHGVPDKNIPGAMGLLEGIRNLETFYTPHDAASLRAELQKTYWHGKKVPMDTYTPDVLNDIHEIQELIAQERFKISNQNCPHSIAQAQSYVWDSKAQQRGEDKPLKQNDHCPDMWRAAIIGPRMPEGPEPDWDEMMEYNDY